MRTKGEDWERANSQYNDLFTLQRPTNEKSYFFSALALMQYRRSKPRRHRDPCAGAGDDQQISLALFLPSSLNYDSAFTTNVTPFTSTLKILPSYTGIHR